MVVEIEGDGSRSS